MRLAFDDGPTELTGEILDLLAAAGEHAVFFVNGKNIEGREDLLRRIVAEGHEIGNHGWSHTASDKLTAGDLSIELGKTSDLVQEITGMRPSKFRPPFARSNIQVEIVANACGLTMFPDSSLGDYAMTAAEVVAAAREVPGTLWLHELPQTVEALPEILSFLGLVERASEACDRDYANRVLFGCSA